jgi:tetratricopeptide (TPR) repeat protein
MHVKRFALAFLLISSTLTAGISSSVSFIVDSVLALPEKDQVRGLWKYYPPPGKDTLLNIRFYRDLQKEFEEKDEMILAQQAWTMELTYTCFFRYTYSPLGIKYITGYIEEANDKGWDVQEAESVIRKGFIYYLQGKYAEGFEFIEKGYQQLKKVGFDKSPGSLGILEQTGTYYYEFGDYEGALEILRDAIFLSTPYIREGDKYVVKNTYALVFQRLGQLDSAIYYFKSAHVDAIRANDDFYTGLTSGNLGYVYYLQGKYDEAIPLMENDYKASLKAREYPSAVNAALALATMKIQQGKTQEAEPYLLYAIDNKNYWNMRDMVGFHKSMAVISRIKGDYEQALHHMDSVLIYSDSARQINDIRILNNSQRKVEVEKHSNEIKLLEAQRGRQVLLRNASLAILLLAGLIGMLWVNRQRLKKSKELEVAAMKQTMAEEELRNARRELMTFTNALKEKNELIETFRSEIEFLHETGQSNQSERMEQIAQLLNSTILTEEDWKEFRNLFDKVYPGFFIRLKEKFTDLSPADTRLLALTKLQLAPKEMAAMLGITYDAIKKSRQRLRKKIDLPEEGSLDEVVETI